MSSTPMRDVSLRSFPAGRRICCGVEGAATIPVHPGFRSISKTNEAGGSATPISKGRCDAFIHGPLAPSGDHEGQTDADGKEMKLKPFSRLVAVPVHKETIWPVNEEDCARHHTEGSKGIDFG